MGFAFISPTRITCPLQTGVKYEVVGWTLRPPPITSWLPIAFSLVSIGWSTIERFPISRKVLFPESFEFANNIKLCS